MVNQCLSVDKKIEALGEQRIRDINDEINRMIKEKQAWERRIIEFGGPNYRVISILVLNL
jgi:hypothetical protein